MQSKMNRRVFLKTSAVLAGAAYIGVNDAFGAPAATATDIMPLGKTGLTLSRLGIGTGSHNGRVVRSMGQERFNKLMHYAYERGVRYIDTADNYRTHGMVREAIKGLDRDSLFILSKMPLNVRYHQETIERYLQELGTDYIDCLLVHCSMSADWDDEQKAMMDAMAEAKEKGLIRVHGVSCHTLPALKVAAKLDWVDVNLVRINPMGAYMDTIGNSWGEPPKPDTVPPVIEQVELMRKRGNGIIGMKIIGNGDFTNPADREKSIRFAMQPGLVDAVTIGFANTHELDEAIERMNNALAGQRAPNMEAVKG